MPQWLRVLVLISVMVHGVDGTWCGAQFILMVIHPFLVSRRLYNAIGHVEFPPTISAQLPVQHRVQRVRIHGLVMSIGFLSSK